MFTVILCNLNLFITLAEDDDSDTEEEIVDEVPGKKHAEEAAAPAVGEHETKA